MKKKIIVGFAIIVSFIFGAFIGSLNFNNPAGIVLDINNLKSNLPVFCIASLLSLFALFAIVETVFDRAAFKKDVLAIGRYRYLLWDLVTKDVKTKYRRSVLGILWSILNPLLMMAVLTAVFSTIIGARVDGEGGFALFYLTGYIMFNFILF